MSQIQQDNKLSQIEGLSRKICVAVVQLLSHVRLVTPSSFLHGISQQECRSGLAFSSPGYLPNTGKPSTPALVGRFFTTPREPPGNPLGKDRGCLKDTRPGCKLIHTLTPSIHFLPQLSFIFCSNIITPSISFRPTLACCSN